MQSASTLVSCLRTVVVMAGGLGAAAMAWAGEPPVPTPTFATPEIETPTQWTTVKPREVNLLAAPVGVARLEGFRGGDSSKSSNSLIVIDGKVEDNIADDVLGGPNTITSGAFDSANGINTVIQNSGSNVLIQNATIVNVNFNGTPL